MDIFVFDLDGVIFKSPSVDSAYPERWDDYDWEFYWRSPMEVEINEEIVYILKELNIEHHVLILTARPNAVQKDTLIALRRYGIYPVGVDESWPFLPQIKQSNNLWLRTCDLNLAENDWEGSGIWKANRLEDLQDEGHNIMFMIEDFKKSADQIRMVAPVLLYEHHRP